MTSTPLIGTEDIAEQLEAIPWAHRTPRLHALDHRFAVRTTDAGLGRYLDLLLGSLASSERPAVVYSILELEDRAEARYAFYADGTQIALCTTPGECLSWLLWHVNRAAASLPGASVRLHAAAAERDGAAILIPGPSGAGKTTLVARLLQSGLRYLADEVVAVESTSLVVLPYPKPLSVESGAFRSLGDVDGVEPASDTFRDPATPPDSVWLRPLAVGCPSPAALVVAPGYRPGSRTEVEPVRSADALVLLAESSFDLPARGESGLRILAAMAERVPCYRLIFGDLDAAVDMVIELLDRSTRSDEAG